MNRCEPDPDINSAHAAPPTTPQRRWRSDDGFTGVAATVMLLVALAGGGLIFDGGRALAARRDAINDAEAAARAGAAEIGFSGLDTDAATQAARDHLLAAGVAANDIQSIEVAGFHFVINIIHIQLIFRDFLNLFDT